MSDYYVGEIRLFAYGQIPTRDGWVVCDGRTLNVQQNIALFSIIGNQFGGDGRTTFALPDLRGRVPACPRNVDPTKLFYGKQQGAIMGEEGHVLASAETPVHTHTVAANSNTGTVTATKSNVWAAGAATGQNVYDAFPATPPPTPTFMNNAAVTTSGEGVAHNNMQPFAVLNYCIATMGLYPPRND